MHVLLITVAYKSKFNPVNSLFFNDQAKALLDYGCKIGVVCSMPITFPTIWKSKRLIFSDEIYDDNGVMTYVSPFISFPKFHNRIPKIRLEQGKRLFKKYIQENERPDIIHVHTFLAGEIAVWIKKNYNIPFVVTEHSSNFERNLFSKNKLRLAKKVFGNSSSNIVVSHQLAQSINKHIGNIDFKIIPNIVDVSFFKPLIEKRSYYNFITVGRLDDNKNQSQLIEVFSKKFRNNKNINLIIVGDGPTKHKLQSQINENNMSKQITLFGRATRNEVLKLLQKSDYFILSSKVETFGVVLIEAMSCGLPVLSTKSGGPESIITSVNLGKLCDEENLGIEITNILNTNYDTKHIRMHVVNTYSEKVIVEKLINIYSEII